MSTSRVRKLIRAELPMISAIAWVGTIYVLLAVKPSFLGLSYGGPILLIGTVLTFGWGLVRAWSD